jgi:hypothetical protein
MPKGTKLKDASPPPLAGCDFCGDRFHPVQWNQRTCHTCAAAGAPDQSIGNWVDYMRAVMSRLRDSGRRKPVTGAAAWRATPKPNATGPN